MVYLTIKSLAFWLDCLSHFGTQKDIILACLLQAVKRKIKFFREKSTVNSYF
jgi:hypothetical protein